METTGALSDDELLDDASATLFQLGRVFSRAPLHDLLTAQTGRAVELSRILVVQALEHLAGADDQEITIGTVADYLAIDPSTASRLVGEALREGFVERLASSVDARRARLVLTARGAELARHALRYQRSIFDQITHDWTLEERRLFARLFIRFARGVSAAHGQDAADGA